MPGKSCRNERLRRDRLRGECSYWACIPSKTVMLPGEAVHGARKAAAKAKVDGGQRLLEG
jgi:dihydrolipoamide dehydrogenase